MIPEMTPTEFVRRRNAGEEMTLLDVREPSEVAEASVPGALHIPMAQVPHRLQELDPAREIVVLCRSGGRSFQVAMYLRQRRPRDPKVQQLFLDANGRPIGRFGIRYVIGKYAAHAHASCPSLNAKTVNRVWRPIPTG